MDKQLLFIMEKKSMIASALMQSMEQADFEVTQVKADVTDISRITERPRIWVLYLQGLERKMTDVLSYIKDQIDEAGVRFFVIGTPDELEETLNGFPSKSLRASFSRPFRADEVIDRLTMEALNVQKMGEARRILVVDDDPTTLNTMKEILSGVYRVYTANSGMNAVQMLVNTEVDLILLDYEMPVIKGPTVLEMLRSETHTKDIPVMFLTSKNDRHAIINVMSLGPANYLLKSLSASELLQKIAEFFENEGRQV